MKIGPEAFASFKEVYIYQEGNEMLYVCTFWYWKLSYLNYLRDQYHDNKLRKFRSQHFKLLYNFWSSFDNEPTFCLNVHFVYIYKLSKQRDRLGFITAYDNWAKTQLFLIYYKFSTKDFVLIKQIWPTQIKLEYLGYMWLDSFFIHINLM